MQQFVDLFAILGSIATAFSVLAGLNAYKIQQRMEYFRSFRRDFSRFSREFAAFDQNLSPTSFFEAETNIYNSLKDYRRERDTPFKEFMTSNFTRAQINRTFLYYILDSKINIDSRKLIDNMDDIYYTHFRQFPATFDLVRQIITICQIQIHSIIEYVSNMPVEDKYINNIVDEFIAGKFDEIGTIERIASLASEAPAHLISDAVQPLLDNVGSMISLIDNLHVHLTDKELDRFSKMQRKSITIVNEPKHNFDHIPILQRIFESLRSIKRPPSDNLRDDCIRNATIIAQIFEKHAKSET